MSRKDTNAATVFGEPSTNICVVRKAPEMKVNEFEKGVSVDLNEFEQLRITAEKEVPKSKPFAYVFDSPVLARRNITPATAESKAGKSALKNKVIACALSFTGTTESFNGLKVEPNRDQKAIIDFDTEQSEDDQQYNLCKTLECVGLNSTPDWYLSYNVRTIAMSNLQEVTNKICEAANGRFGGIHLIVVDGAADYIDSVTDEAQANAIVAYFVALSVKYNCPVLLVIHLNENAGKNGDTMPRGHIGRQAVRKGYCQLNITKEGDISTLQVLRARKAGSDTPLLCFKYDKCTGYHVSIDSGEIKLQRQTEKDESKRQYFDDMAKKIFAPPIALRQTDAVSAIMKSTGKQHSTAKTYLNNLVGWGFVEKGIDGLYRQKP